MRYTIAGPGEPWTSPIGQGTIKDYQICKWPSGKVYIRYLLADMVDLLAQDLVKNIRNGYDNLIVIEGPEGSGKSNLAYTICEAYSQASGAGAFDIEQQYIYNTENFKEKLKAGNDKKSVFWMDEGSNMANNRDWNTTGNKDLIGLLETMRSRGWTLCLCIPTHERLDCYIREFRLKYLIRCGPMDFQSIGHKDRGYFEVKKRNPYGKIETIGYGDYSPIPPEQKAIYEAIKLRSQEQMIKEVVEGDQSNGSKYKAKYETMCKKQDSIMLALYNSGHDSDGLMQLFGIESKQTFFNKLTKARKESGA